VAACFALRDGRAVLMISALSFLLWAAHTAIFYLVLLALGLELPAYASLVVLVFTSLGVLLPSGPEHREPGSQVPDYNAVVWVEPLPA